MVFSNPYSLLSLTGYNNPFLRPPRRCAASALRRKEVP
jgi:hypothetical protein